MYTTAFEYHRAGTADEAVTLLSRYGDDARLLAGGHSLIPLMKLRLARPAHLVDIRRASDLVGVREEGGTIVIGAATTHRALSESELVRSAVPILAEAAGQIGDPQVRNMGTIGGSLAHADPAADLPAVALALDAQLGLIGPDGARTIPAEGFFHGLMATALGPGELLREIRVRRPAARTGGAYAKHEHPASRYAIVGVAAMLTLDEKGAIASARVGITGVDTHAFRAGAVEAALAGVQPDEPSLAAAAARATEGLELDADRTGSAEYRANLLRVYCRRALERALQRAGTA